MPFVVKTPLPLYAGLTGIVIRITAPGSSVRVNGVADDAMADEASDGLFAATIAEELVGAFTYTIYRSGTIIQSGWCKRIAAQAVVILDDPRDFVSESLTDGELIASQILAGLDSVSITRIGPQYTPADRSITLIAGDDYLVANGNALTFGITLPGIDLANSTAQFAAAAGYKTPIAGTATLVDVNTQSPKLRLEWTKAQTNKTPGNNYSWAVRILNASLLQQTIIMGPLTIKASPFQ